MDDGAIGVNSLRVVLLVEEGIKLRQDSATTQHLPMEELIVSDQTLTQFPAIIRIALLVKTLH